MTTMMLINFISEHPEYENVVIKDEDDRNRINAIERLSANFDDEKIIDWKINTTLEKNTLLIYA